MSGGSSNARVTDICESEGGSAGDSKHKKTYALVYISVALGVIFVFCLMAFAAVYRKRRSLNQPTPNSSFHRSLSRYVGPDRSQSIMSVSFLPESASNMPFKRHEELCLGMDMTMMNLAIDLVTAVCCDLRHLAKWTITSVTAMKYMLSPLTTMYIPFSFAFVKLCVAGDDCRSKGESNLATNHIG